MPIFVFKLAILPRVSPIESRRANLRDLPLPEEDCSYESLPLARARFAVSRLCARTALEINRPNPGTRTLPQPARNFRHIGRTVCHIGTSRCASCFAGFTTFTPDDNCSYVTPFKVQPGQPTEHILDCLALFYSSVLCSRAWQA